MHSTKLNKLLRQNFLYKQRSSPAAVTLNKERDWIAPLETSANIKKKITSQELIQEEEK